MGGRFCLGRFCHSAGAMQQPCVEEVGFVQIAVNRESLAEQFDGAHDIAALLEHFRSTRQYLGDAQWSIWAAALQVKGASESRVGLIKVSAFQRQHAEAEVCVALIWIEPKVLLECGSARSGVAVVIVRPAKEVGRRRIWRGGGHRSFEPRDRFGIGPLAVMGEPH